MQRTIKLSNQVTRLLSSVNHGIKHTLLYAYIQVLLASPLEYNMILLEYCPITNLDKNGHSVLLSCVFNCVLLCFPGVDGVTCAVSV